MQMDVILLQPDDAKFIEKLAERVAEKLRYTLTIPTTPIKHEKIYLTRKDTAIKLGVSAPTVDQFVSDNILTKLGSGKRTRFRLEDVENIYENLDKYYRRSRKNVSAQNR
jgi:hypothetical protein